MNHSALTQTAKVLGLLALAGTIIPPLLFLTNHLAIGPMKIIMLVAMLVWFVTAPLWLKGGDH
jgi:hypothetical protein